MQNLRAAKTDAEKEEEREYYRWYYAMKRQDVHWRARKWDRNAVASIRRTFNWEGGEEWVEAANQLRIVRGFLSGNPGRPRLRVASQ